MKRSEINAILRDVVDFCKRKNFQLPPWAYWSPEDWAQAGHECDEIRDNMLGWDITDYGEGHFETLGFSLVTIRNGNQKMKDKYSKVYAEKLLMVKEGQYAPMHFHWNKMEDIINRGGGNLLIRVYMADKEDDGKFSDEAVTVHTDGREYQVPAGTQVCLKPGESITIYPYMYHDFNVEAGTGTVLIGEVSMCNDDNTDNRFYEKLGRFPAIEEDEVPYRLLCNEYPAAK